MFLKRHRVLFNPKFWFVTQVQLPSDNNSFGNGKETELALAVEDVGQVNSVKIRLVSRQSFSLPHTQLSFAVSGNVPAVSCPHRSLLLLGVGRLELSMEARSDPDQECPGLRRQRSRPHVLLERLGYNELAG